MNEYQQMGLIAVNLDIVYCIDATADMQNCFDTIKNITKTLHTDIAKELAERARIVEQLRVKVIVFRDFSCDGEYALQQSKIFNLPDETAECEKFIDDIRAFGGGDSPASALEALHLAINSEWDNRSDIQDSSVKRRHIIVLFTDAPAHRLDDTHYRKKASENLMYPKDCPSDFAGLVKEWENNIDTGVRRLIILAPDTEPWYEFDGNFEPCLVRFAKLAEGLDEITNDEIIHMICGY